MPFQITRAPETQSIWKEHFYKFLENVLFCSSRSRDFLFPVNWRVCFQVLCFQLHILFVIQVCKNFWYSRIFGINILTKNAQCAVILEQWEMWCVWYWYQHCMASSFTQCLWYLIIWEIKRFFNGKQLELDFTFESIYISYTYSTSSVDSYW